MKRNLFVLLILALMTASSCHRSTCPTFDDNPGEKSMQGGGKTKSGVYPKKMK